MEFETNARRDSGGGVRPLGTDDWARVDRVARRLHSELTAFVAGMPPSARHASGMARHLGVDRTTCQRAVFAATRPYPGPGLLGRMPGVRGLRLLAEAASKSDPACEHALVDAFAAAVERYHELVTQLGRSSSQLIKRIAFGVDASAQASDSGEAPSVRTRLFDAAAEVTGRASDCWVAVYAYRPSPRDGDALEVVNANGLVGHQAAPDAVPLVVHNFSTPTDDGEYSEEARFASLEHTFVEGSSPTVVLDDFTTSPPPLVTARQPDEFLVQSIDEAAGPGLRDVDLMLAARKLMPHPKLTPTTKEEVWALINFPVRHMVFDVYLHRDLARTCLPSLDVHLWGPDFAQHIGDRWQTRFAESPSLELLDTIPRSSPPAYPRMTELTDHLFERSGFDPAGFVGYRCNVSYPLWRSGYCISLDFTQPDEA